MKLILPLLVHIPRKTKDDRVMILNLNVYRNTHPQILNKAKQEYKQQVADALSASSGAVPKPPLCFTYTIYPSTNRAFDLGNVGSIIQKFTDDALIELGVINDDNFKVINEVRYRIGTVNKENPHAELVITGGGDA